MRNGTDASKLAFTTMGPTTATSLETDSGDSVRTLSLKKFPTDILKCIAALKDSWKNFPSKVAMKHSEKHYS